MIKHIPLDQVKPGMVTAEAVHAPYQSLPVVQAQTVLTDEIIERFRQLYVKKIPVEIYQVPDREVPVQQELPEIKPVLEDKLRKEAVSGIRHMFDVVSMGSGEEHLTTAFQVVKELDVIVDKLVDTLSTESNALISITDLKSHDDYTYHHSLSVAVLTIAISQGLNLSETAVKRMGRCAIMHDIGKMMVPLDVLNKNSRLDEREFAVIKKHSQNGFDYLVRGCIVDDEIREGVLSHHEKMDGSGYPYGLRDKELPLMSRVVSIADVYDAVTSYRPYRSPMAPAEALELIMSEVGRSFDYDIVKTFINKINLYPINTCVELSNRRFGIVVDNTNAMRPVVKMLDNKETIDLMRRTNLNLIITRVISGRR